MQYDIIVPRFDEDGAQVVVSKWYKKAGEPVFKDDVLAEVETGTVNCTITSPVDGVMSVIYIPEGRQTRLGAQIASIEEKEVSNTPDKRIKMVADSNEIKLQERMAEQAFTSHEFAKELEQEELLQEEKHVLEKKRELEEEMAEQAFATGLEQEFKAHELASTIVENRPETNADNWNKPTSIPNPDDYIEKLDLVRAKVAEQRAKSAAINTVINEIDMSSIISLTHEFGPDFEKQKHVRLGYTPFIIKSVIAALHTYPMFNAYIRDNEVIYKRNFDIALGTQGLDSSIFPVIRFANEKSIAQLEREMIILSEKSKKHELTLEETSGGTFMLINAGIYGSLLGSPVVTYPNISSLAIHKVMHRPVAIDNQVLIRPMMYISLSYDSRLANTRDASMFLNQIKKILENIGYFALDL